MKPILPLTIKASFSKKSVVKLGDKSAPHILELMSVTARDKFKQCSGGMCEVVFYLMAEGLRRRFGLLMSIFMPGGF